VAASRKRKLRFALVGSESLRGREIKSVLSLKKFPLQSFELYDPDVEEEFSKLTRFRDEPKVVHHLEPKSLAGLDLVFLASDAKTNTACGRLAAELDYRALDLAETFNADKDVPVVVAGVNDAALRGKNVSLVANPNPVTIILSHLFHALHPAFKIAKALAFVLEPVSVFEEAGIQELADQSFALLNGAAVPKKIFREQAAFNLLSRTEKPNPDGFSVRESRVLAEVRRVLAPADFPLSLASVLAPVFHTCSVMVHVELGRKATIADLEACFRRNDIIQVGPAEGSGLVSATNVAGKDKIFVGQIKRADDAAGGGFWIWAVSDNLTLGSALNAYEIARSLFEIS